MDRTIPDERRRYARYSIDRLPVRFCSERLDEADTVFVQGAVADIGRGGLFVHSDHVETPGTVVQLLLSVPRRTTPVSIQGRVAWVDDRHPRSRGMGIAVTGSPLEQAVVDHCLGR